MPSICYIDGEYVDIDAARIPATDLSVLRGYGVFDFMRTYKGGEPFHLEAHVARLFRSAALIDLEMPWTQDEVIALTRETISRNESPEFNVRIIVTGGESPGFLMPEGKSRLLVLVTPVTIMDDIYYTEGAPLITVDEARILPDAKTINYIPAIMALKVAKSRGAIDAVYVNSEGMVLEGTTNNLFIFKGDTLVTAGDGVLPGITRTVVLELARSVFEVEVRDVSLQEAYDAEEAFLTSSVKEVMPIKTLDDRVIGAGAPGPNTRRMMQLFAEYAGARLRV